MGVIQGSKRKRTRLFIRKENNLGEISCESCWKFLQAFDDHHFNIVTIFIISGLFFFIGIQSSPKIAWIYFIVNYEVLSRWMPILMRYSLVKRIKIFKQNTYGDGYIIEIRMWFTDLLKKYSVITFECGNSLSLMIAGCILVRN